MSGGTPPQVLLRTHNFSLYKTFIELHTHMCTCAFSLKLFSTRYKNAPTTFLRQTPCTTLTLKTGRRDVMVSIPVS